MRSLVVTLGLLLLAACATTPQGNPEQDVWARVEALNVALFDTRDAAVMRSHVGEPLTYGHSDGRLENKAQMVTNASTSANRYRQQKTERVHMNIDGNVAIARHTFSAQQTNAQGVESPLKISVIQTWVKQDGQWLLRGRQAVRLP